jgi:3-polyprenyl-4-hydroxybenzoate decarboxylase
MVFRHILSTDDGPIGIVTINRPEFLNSINAEVCSELSEAITTTAASHTLRVIIITGAGDKADKAFVAGDDIRFMVSATPAQAVIISQAVTHFQADRDLVIVPESQGSKLDPSTRNGVGAKMGMGATKPLGVDEMKFMRICVPGEDQVDFDGVAGTVQSRLWRSVIGG